MSMVLMLMMSLGQINIPIIASLEEMVITFYIVAKEIIAYTVIWVTIFLMFPFLLGKPLDGGLGNDQLYASNTTSNNSLKGGAGGDYFNINNSSGKNFLDGGSENDSFSASYTTGNNTLNGGEGNDYLYIYHSSGNNLKGWL